MPQPKEKTNTAYFKGFQNKQCEFFPCHTGIRTNEFNCLFCYCPLAWLQCPGPYDVFTDANGQKRKDCSACKLNHDGLEKSWNFIQHWLEHPKQWEGKPQTEQRMKAATPVEHPRKADASD